LNKQSLLDLKKQLEQLSSGLHSSLHNGIDSKTIKDEEFPNQQSLLHLLRRFNKKSSVFDNNIGSGVELQERERSLNSTSDLGVFHAENF
jgi:hypothetical protein